MAQTLVIIPGSPHPLVAGKGAALVYRETYDLAGSYATVKDIREISFPENGAHDFSPPSIERWLRIATSRINSHLGQRWNIPLAHWSEAVVWAVCEVAYAGLVGKRGHDPTAKTEKTVGEREAEALDWVKSAQNYEVTPDPRLILAEPAHIAQTHSDVPRGWSGFSRSRRPGGSGGGFF